MNRQREPLDVVFAALGNGHRRRIVDLVALQPATIQQIAQHVGMSLTAINRHIQVLEDAGLVMRRKVGRANVLSIRRSAMRDVQEWALQYNTMWGTDAESLENYAAALSDGTTIAATPHTTPKRERNEEVPFPVQGLHDADS